MRETEVRVQLRGMREVCEGSKESERVQLRHCEVLQGMPELPMADLVTQNRQNFVLSDLFEQRVIQYDALILENTTQKDNDNEKQRVKENHNVRQNDITTAFSKLLSGEYS